MPTWIPHDDLLGDTPLACVDGRCTHDVIATPGGNLGEFLVVLAALERFGVVLDDRSIEAALDSVLAVFGRFYFHTDSDAVTRMWSNLGIVALNSADLEQTLRHPPQALRERLLEAVTHPEHIGCGHIAAMRRDPVAYGIRPQVVDGALRAVYQALWRDETPVVFDILDGRHDEQSVVSVGSCPHTGAHSLSLVPAEERSQFVYHPDAARWLRHHLARLLAGSVLTPAEVGPLQIEADRLAEIQHGATFAALAHGLPTRAVAPCP